jgi:hypothetical protein
MWICPNGENNETYGLLKLHHSLTDGLGCLIALGSTQDVYRPEEFIQTTTVLPLWQKALFFVLKPFTLTYAFIFFLFWRTDKNCIKPGDAKLDGLKNNAISKCF